VSSDRVLHRPTTEEPFLAFCDNGMTAQKNTVFVVDKYGTTEHLRTDGKAYVVKKYPNYGFVLINVMVLQCGDNSSRRDKLQN